MVKTTSAVANPGVQMAEHPQPTRLSHTETLAIQLLEHAQKLQETPYGGLLKLSTLNSFAHAIGHSSKAVFDAYETIKRFSDPQTRFVDWALSKGWFDGEQKATLSMSSWRTTRATEHFGWSVQDVARVVALVNAEGRILASRPGFVGRVKRNTAGIPGAEQNLLSKANELIRTAKRKFLDPSEFGTPSGGVKSQDGLPPGPHRFR